MRLGIPGEIARRAVVTFFPEEGCFLVPYLGDLYRVYFPTGKVEKDDKVEKNVGEQVLPEDQILLLLYLATASGRPLTGWLVSFKELWGGYTYLDAFNRGPVKMLARVFGAEPHLLLEAARVLGGEKLDRGDAAANEYLETEAIVGAAAYCAHRLKKIRDRF